MPREDAQLLRRRFERGADVTAQGSGLGLSIVEAAIEPAGGTLELRDRRPQGLAAVLHFPRIKVVCQATEVTL